MSVVALDVGTSRMKALLAHWDGRIVEVGAAPTPTLSEAPDQLAFPADAIRARAASLVAGVAAAHPEDPVDTIVFSCLGTAMVPVDRSERPLGPALSPADARPTSVPGLMNDVDLGHDQLFDITGQVKQLSSSLHQWLWWRRMHPEAMRSLYRFRSLRGFLVEGLCGADAEDASWASRTMLMDLATDTWSETVLAAAGLPADALPAIHRSTAAWPVDSAAARTFGLAPAARVVLGAMDNCCSFLGASDPDEDRLVNVAGTFEHMAGVGPMSVVRSAAQAVNGLIHRYVLRGTYLSYSRVPLGPLLNLLEAASPGGLVPLMDAVSDQPVGVSMRLDPGAVHDALEADTDPGTVVQRVMESSCAVLACYTDAWAAAGGGVDRIVAVGGGAAHANILQLKANVLGRPVSTLASDEAACLGALRLATIAVQGVSPSVAAGLFPNPVARTWSPRPS